MEIIWVGIGGAFGGIARFQLGKLISKRANTAFPLATFAVNISGALLLGLVTGMNIGGNTYLLLCEGFLGAYTTFSTFMVEGFTLFREKKKLNAFVYILGSLVIGILGFTAGYLIGNI